MGKELSEDEKTKKAWDSNAITPGTPFMDFLAVSLRYWVVKKMNSDPGWKQVHDMISDYHCNIEILADTSDYFGFKCSW
jgi:5'-3' exoribonuclease 2